MQQKSEKNPNGRYKKCGQDWLDTFTLSRTVLGHPVKCGFYSIILYAK